jgi:hypothetical protein
MMAERPPQGAQKYLDREVVSADGARLGIVGKLLSNRFQEVPEWLVVEAGVFGRKRLIVPVAGSELGDEIVMLAYTREVVEAAPHADPDGSTGTLSAEEEDALNAHFGLGAQT